MSRATTALVILAMNCVGCLWFDTTAVELSSGRDADGTGDAHRDAERTDDARLDALGGSDAVRDFAASDISAVDDGPGDPDLARQDAQSPDADPGDLGRPDAGPADMGPLDMNQPDLVVTGIPQNGLELWLRADRGLTVGGQEKVDAWQDQSPNGRTLTTNQTVRRATLFATELAGKPVLRFFGGQEYRLGDSTALIGAREWTLFWVGKQAQTDREGAIVGTWDASHGVSQIRFNGSADSLHVESDSWGLTWTTAIQDTTAQFQILRIRADGTTLTVHQGSNQTASMPHTPSGEYRVSAVGAHRDGRFVRGDIAEVLFYGRALTAAEIGAVEADLRSRWSLP